MSVKWVVGGISSSSQAAIAYSTDGQTFTNSSNAATIFGAGIYFSAIAHNGSIWVAGSTPSGSSSTIGYSYDAITWYVSSSGKEILNISVNGITYGNGMFVAIGGGSSGCGIMYSYDGINWTVSTSSIGFGWGMGVIYRNSIWVAWGGGSSTTKNIATSTNAINWTIAPSTNFTEVGGIDWNGTNWVICGGGSDHIMYTTNIAGSLSSTGVGGCFGNRGRCVRWSGSKFIAGGISNALIKTSTNGVTWNTVTSTKFASGSNNAGGCLGINYNNGIWLLGQAYGNGYSLLYSSNDGATWNNTTTSVFPSGYVWSIAHSAPPVLGSAPTITSITNGMYNLNVFFTPGTGGIPSPSTYYYSLNGESTYTNANSTTSPILISGLIPGTTYNVTLIANNLAGNTAASNVVVSTTTPYPCFLQGSKILRLNPETDEESYVPVETLREGDLIRTHRNGYKAIFHIGRKTLQHPADDPNPRNRLYRFPKSKIPGMREDLCITGEHCTLHTSLSTELKDRVEEHMGDIYITEYMYRVPACLDERAVPYKGDGPVTIWHFALENHNIYHNYGVYANGLLVESCSIQYLTELANMELVYDISGEKNEW